MRFFEIKNPFNSLSQDVLKNKMCFQLDRYCMEKGEAVAVFHMNDPDDLMVDYMSDDGLMYLNAPTMKLIAQLLVNADVSERLRTYLDTIRDDLENRARLPIPIITCFRTPLPEVMKPIEMDSTSLSSVISDVFQKAIYE